jgi:hypothetical protein
MSINYTLSINYNEYLLKDRCSYMSIYNGKEDRNNQ